MVAEGVCDLTETEILPSTLLAFGLGGACETGRPLQTDPEIQGDESLQAARERPLRPKPRERARVKNRMSGVSVSRVSGLQPSRDRTKPSKDSADSIFWKQRTANTHLGLTTM